MRTPLRRPNASSRAEKSEKIRYLRRKRGEKLHREHRDKRTEATEGKAHFFCGEGGSAVRAAVSPRSEGLKRGETGSPGFRHAEGVGDTRMLSCVMPCILHVN